MVIKNPAAGLDAAIAVMRKLGKGDPVAYLRALNWHDIGKQAAGEVTDKINGLRDALKEITDSFILRHTLPDEALAGMQTTLRQLDDITPKITQSMQQAAQQIGQKVNKALDDYQGIKPSSGTVGQPHKTVAKELALPKGNELPGAKPVFEGQYKGRKLLLPNVSFKNISYVKRNRVDYHKLRSSFNNGVRQDFLKTLANMPQILVQLKKQGITDTDIAKLNDGRVLSGWQVHHKLPLDDGGTNDLENLILIRNSPEHSAFTTFQKQATSKLIEGEEIFIDWPIPAGLIYPN